MAESIIIATLLVGVFFLGKIAYGDRFLKRRRKSVYSRRGLIVI